MTLAELLILVVIAFVTGTLGQALAGFYVGGCFVSTLLGFVGAFVGLWLARELNLPEILVITVGDETFPIVWSVVGAGILSVIAGLLVGPPRPVV